MPKFEPTDAQREIVAALAAAKTPLEKIAEAIFNPRTKRAISVKVLRRLFKEQLTAKVDALVKAYQGLNMKFITPNTERPVLNDVTPKPPLEWPKSIEHHSGPTIDSTDVNAIKPLAMDSEKYPFEPKNNPQYRLTPSGEHVLSSEDGGPKTEYDMESTRYSIGESNCAKVHSNGAARRVRVVKLLLRQSAEASARCCNG